MGEQLNIIIAGKQDIYYSKTKAITKQNFKQYIEQQKIKIQCQEYVWDGRFLLR